MSSGGSRQFTRMTTACARALIFLLCLPATIAHSLPDDRNQPIHITADKALRNEVEGVTIYSGNVAPGAVLSLTNWSDQSCIYKTMCFSLNPLFAGSDPLM